MNLQRLVFIFAIGACLSVPVLAQGTRLLRHPTVSRDLVAFEHGGDLWVVSRDGGQARRVTSTQGVELDPYFSPDGSQIAYSATVAGNTDVYVIPTAGGDPKRLTCHPGLDRVRGWTPDGRNVVFASVRTSAPQQAYWRLWSISINGGLPEPLPMPRAFSVAYSSDGKKLAYEEITTEFIPPWYQHRQRIGPEAGRLFRAARWRAVNVADRGDLWSKGHDHQRVSGFGWRRTSLLLPLAQTWAARRHANVGCAGRHTRYTANDRRRWHHRADTRVLRSLRSLGS